jgi:hypothetical protein
MPVPAHGVGQQAEPAPGVTEVSHPGWDSTVTGGENSNPEEECSPALSYSPKFQRDEERENSWRQSLHWRYLWRKKIAD